MTLSRSAVIAFSISIALLEAEQRIVFLGITGDRDDEAVEELAAAMDQVQVAVRNGIERSGIDGNDLFQWASAAEVWSFDFILRRSREAIDCVQENMGALAPGPHVVDFCQQGLLASRPAPWASASGAASALATAASAFSAIEVSPSALRTSLSSFS